jgi:protein arginine kinase
MNETTREQMRMELEEILDSQKIKTTYAFVWRSSDTIGYAEQRILNLKYGIDHKKYESRGYEMVEDSKQNMRIFIATEDHLNIQVCAPGLKLSNLLDQVDAFDDRIDSLTEYAFDMELGYLTSQVTNVGTGIHGTVIMHLPALLQYEEVETMSQAAAKLGLGISKVSALDCAGFYQIQNHITLGRSEVEIIDTLSEVTRQIARRENEALEKRLVEQRIEVEDQVFRALGVLRNARIIRHGEALQHLSSVRMGVHAGLISNWNLRQIDALIFAIDTAEIQLGSHKILSASELNEQRGRLCRAFFK